MERSKDEKYLMTPYSLDEDRNKKDPRAGYCIEELKNKPFREPLAKFAKAVTDRAKVQLGKEDITAESPEYCARSVSRWRSVIQEHLLI